MGKYRRVNIFVTAREGGMEKESYSFSREIKYSGYKNNLRKK
jgi:hypothetical protein